MRTTTILLFASLLITGLSGCTFFQDADRTTLAELGWDGEDWPDLTGRTVTVLSYDISFYAQDVLAPAFEELTGATVEFIAADDAGAVLQRLIQERGDPSFDVAYGIDNALIAQAAKHNVFEAYQPLLSTGIDPGLVWRHDWLVTPVNHGWHAINIDKDAGIEAKDLFELRGHADRLVVSDPRFSSPGLGFLITTVKVLGESDAYDYLDYWSDLFDEGVHVERSWGDAYAGHFSAAGDWTGAENRRDKAIVLSYTSSPAYETWGGEPMADVLLGGATFHQIQTMGIADGARDLAAAQAFIEFALTETFQRASTEWEAIYPAVPGHDASADVFGDADPGPGTFTAVDFDPAVDGPRVEGWVRAWTELFEAKTA